MSTAPPSTADTANSRRPRRPLLGLRRVPGRCALAVFRMPLRLYRHGGGWVLGHTFLLLVHAGRHTGRRYEAVAMVLGYDPERRNAVVCSAWGPDADWVRNLRARPALEVCIGRECFVPEHHFLTAEEAFHVGIDFRRRHPWRLRLVSAILGWGDLRSDDALRQFVDDHPFVSLRPAHRLGQ